MRKIYLSLIALLFVSGYSFGQEVSQKQKMLLTKITATWCPICGTAAWDTKEDLLRKYGEDAVFLTTHISSSSELYSSTAKEYATNLPSVQGQPIFYVNRTKYNTGNITNAAEEMKQSLKSQPVLANTGIEMQLDGQTLEVRAKVQFFEPTSGEYYLSLFILENKVKANQASRGNNVEHPKVLRSRITTNTFGELIVNGSVEANQTFDFRLNKALRPEWNTTNLEVAAIIWKKNGDTYEFVNTESVAQYSTFTSVNLLEKAGAQLAVMPNTLSTQSTIEITLPTIQEALSLQLINSNGQIVKQVFTGDLPGGTHRFSLEKSNNLASGVYLLQLQKGGHSITQKVVVQ